MFFPCNKKINTCQYSFVVTEIWQLNFSFNRKKFFNREEAVDAT